jgi:hypothetical protein
MHIVHIDLRRDEERPEDGRAGLTDVDGVVVGPATWPFVVDGAAQLDSDRGADRARVDAWT